MLRREAAGWLARLQSGRDPGIEEKFRRWVDAHPSHARAFERVSSSYEQAGLLRQSPAARLQSGALPAANPAAAQWLAPALAASVALLAAAGLYLLRTSERTEAVMLTSGVGEIRQVKLSDGSRVTLDTATSVEVEIGRSRRHARIDHGRARFDVAAAAQPFEVDAAQTRLMTRQGTVDVEVAGTNARIDLLAGRAEIRGPGEQQGLSLEAPQAASSNGAGLALAGAAGAEPDWTRGMIQFDGTPLASAVALANRYSVQRIRLGPGLDGLRVTGAFHAGDVKGLANALAAAFGLTLIRDGEGNFLLSAPNALAKPEA